MTGNIDPIGLGGRPVLVVGSASIHVARFVRGLGAAGCGIVVATHGHVDLGAPPGLMQQAVLNLDLRSMSAQRDLRALMQRWKPAIVHAHQANSGAWHALRASRHSGVPLVVTLWGSDVLRLHERNRLHQWMVGHTLRRASAWTADARVLLEAAGRLCEHVDGQVREWIPIGIDVSPGPGAQARERRLLSCRLHKPLYRVDAILRAFARLPASRTGWKLEIAAAGPDTDALKGLARDLGLNSTVEFTGMLDAGELARAYRRSAVFVSVPESDGTSVSLLEAMFAGCLPVLSDLPANREWVRDGRNGLLVNDLDELGAALVRAIDWWESGLWDGEGRQINERLVADKAIFSRNMMEFVSLYDRLLGRPSVPGTCDVSRAAGA